MCGDRSVYILGADKKKSLKHDNNFFLICQVNQEN